MKNIIRVNKNKFEIVNYIISKLQNLSSRKDPKEYIKYILKQNDYQDVIIAVAIMKSKRFLLLKNLQGSVRNSV